MEIISVKFQEDVLVKMDANIAAHNFNSRTEFIREAVRDKLAQLNRENLIEDFLKFKGKSNIKTTDAANRRTRDLIGKEILKDFDKRFG